MQLVTKQRQNVKDWPAFHAFVRQYDLFEMLQKRLADKAVEENVAILLDALTERGLFG